MIEDDVQELLARAYQFDDKPHLIFSWIASLAARYEKDVVKRMEIIRLMSWGYDNIGKMEIKK